MGEIQVANRWRSGSSPRYLQDRMTGVATHDDDHSGRGLCKKDFEGEMLGPDFAGAGKGSVVLDALEKGSENPPKDVTRPILWKILVRFYDLYFLMVLEP